MIEKAILLEIDWSGRSGPDSDLAATELQELASSAGLSVLETRVVSQRRPTSARLIGSGKAAEIALAVKAKKANVVVLGSDLSPSQQRNLEDVLGTKTIDRTQLILDIFAQRARSTEGKLQVELAQLKYLLPRLSGKGIELSRLGGGVGTRGPGEQKLEVDRRRIRDRIVRLERELQNLQTRRLTGIRRKKEKDLPMIALVGYTNAGKSSLFNLLTGAAVLVKDRLFSTLDTTTRLVELPGSQKALLVDTVGFIRDLPHHLVESFKATLEETVHADLLLHVVDAAREDLEGVQAAVRGVLSDLGADDARTLLLFNKCDLLTDPARRALRQTTPAGTLFISTKTGEGMPELAARLAERVSEGHSARTFFIPKHRLGLAHVLYEGAEVTSRRDTPEGSHFCVRLSAKMAEIFESRLAEVPPAGRPRRA